ncbi:MAG: Bax inhibitor-1/YccA family protein [Pseudomonadota bacterium]
MSSYIEVGTKSEAGLRAYMIRIYQYVALALALSGTSAYFCLSSGLIYSFINTNGISTLGYLAMFSPMLISLFFAFKYDTIDSNHARMLFITYAVLTGISLSFLGLIYTGTSIVKTFFICSVTFMTMSIYGYTTKTDLTAFGSFLYIGVIGLAIAGIINMFLQSSSLYYITSFVGVAVFTGLMAFSVQSIKNAYNYAKDDTEALEKFSIIAALNLYQEFINLFIYLLRFFGERRRD